MITDLGMPDMDGLQVAKEVVSLAPKTPVLLLTGWGVFLDSKNLPEYITMVVSKPPTMEKIRSVLAELSLCI
ncbi:hypothetical protein DC28_03370 [Spirochaeta lutea]|uniref:Response regulatory domain-containing protein n=1 Tax=Spirochaeta lutea TaxID=1480694 RepID=A0A098R027_9SPIO|nr:hypothetical protein DC28_03370 [Spirochaeta lutea]